MNNLLTGVNKLFMVTGTFLAVTGTLNVMDEA